MYDQSFSPATLARLVRKSDFRDFPTIYDDSVKQARIQAASDIAHSDFDGRNPLMSFTKSGKNIYHTLNLSDELVLRKVTLNLRRVTKMRQPDRQSIISNLKHLLAEGTPFRVYRLDISAFYESFITTDVIKKINDFKTLSPQTKRLIEKILAFFEATGGTGIPRGLALSAVLAELMMDAFDESTTNALGVYFYARYVDDIVVVTNAVENERTFLKALVKNLPDGLVLNEGKQHIKCARERVTPSLLEKILFSFSYLGYEFSVKEPFKDKKVRAQRQFRDVKVDISSNKKTRYKTRICRAFLDFSKTADFSLLYDRLKFLTTNFSIRDINTGRRKLAGIFYNYPHLSTDVGGSLHQLDKFLHDAIRGCNGRLFSRTSGLLTARQKRELLTLSFKRGHEKRTFAYFHPTHIHAIQGCWAHE